MYFFTSANGLSILKKCCKGFFTLLPLSTSLKNSLSILGITFIGKRTDLTLLLKKSHPEIFFRFISQDLIQICSRHVRGKQALSDTANYNKIRSSDQIPEISGIIILGPNLKDSKLV
jgi:hypothetical protein